MPVSAAGPVRKQQTNPGRPIQTSCGVHGDRAADRIRLLAPRPMQNT